jgi:hypothetical protein
VAALRGRGVSDLCERGALVESATTIILFLPRNRRAQDSNPPRLRRRDGLKMLPIRATADFAGTPLGRSLGSDRLAEHAGDDAHENSSHPLEPNAERVMPELLAESVELVAFINHSIPLLIFRHAQDTAAFGPLSIVGTTHFAQ